MTEIIERTTGLTPEGLTPPQAVDAERAVLAALLLDHESVGLAVEMIDATAFYRTAHQKMYEAIVALYERNEKADAVTLGEELRKRGELEAVGGVPALSQILEYATASANLPQHIRIIHAKSILRMLIRATGEIQQEAYAGQDDAATILDRAEQRIFAVTDQRVRQGFISMKDLMMPTMKHIEELSERKLLVTGVSSGFDDLDKVTSGFQRSDLVIIAGRPSMGKTSFALNIAENAAIRHNTAVAVFSLEMSKEQLALRLICSQAEVPMFKVRSGHLSSAEWGRLVNLTGHLYKAPIMIDDSAAPSVLEIRAKCRRLKTEGKLELVIVDYLQLIRATGTAENRVQEIGQVTRGLKALAKELDVPVVALSQLSRAVETRGGLFRPQLSDLRESGCLTADTRIVRADTGAEVSLGELLLKNERNVPVWSLDEHLRIVPGTMTHVFASGVKPVFEMRLASGRKVRASANHPFRTLSGWMPLEQVREGDRLAVPRMLPEPTSPRALDDAEIVMLAHLLGDGCFASRQPLHYTSADPANLEAVEEAAPHFGIAPRRVAQGNWWHVYLPSPYPLARGRRNPIHAWLAGFGLNGLRSYEKFIPREVHGLPMDQLRLFLRHLWATDGCVHPGNGRQPRIYYASSSERLIRDLQAILLRFGLVGRIKSSSKAGYRPTHYLDIYGAEQQLRFINEIGVHGVRGEIGRAIVDGLSRKTPNTNVDTIPREIWSEVRPVMRKSGMTTRAFAAGLGTAYCGSTLYKHAPSRERLAAVATLLQEPRLEQLATSDVLWDTIVAITPCGEEPVFDATVPGTHNFIANGIVAHNSIEQDADVVMFVYRGERYKPDDPALQGKAEIIIAKQRNGPTDEVTLTFRSELMKFLPYTPVPEHENPGGF